MGFILGLFFLMMGIWEWKNPYVTVTEDTLDRSKISTEEHKALMAFLRKAVPQADDNL